MTKSGIFLKLEESTYKLKKFDLTFYFSSLFYKEKFSKNVEKYVETENIKLANKTDCVINFAKLFAISYYNKIEKRGFRIFDNKRNKEIKRYTIFEINFIL